MKKYAFRIKGQDYVVEIQQVERNHIELEVNGTHYSVEVLHDLPPAAKTPVLIRTAAPVPNPRESTIPKHSATAQVLRSPLPGMVTQVLVSPGESVEKGAVLLRIEAMKMENEVVAERPCRITSLHVQAGTSVLQHDVLLALEWL
jgi:biotin carboxyl carrier protein